MPRKGVSTKGVQIGESTTVNACIQKTLFAWNFSQLLTKNHYRHAIISLWLVALTQWGGGGEKTPQWEQQKKILSILKETKRIFAPPI